MPNPRLFRASRRCFSRAQAHPAWHRSLRTAASTFFLDRPIARLSPVPPRTCRGALSSSRRCMSLSDRCFLTRCRQCTASGRPLVRHVRVSQDKGPVPARHRLGLGDPDGSQAALRRCRRAVCAVDDVSAAAGPWVVSERSGCFWFLGGEMKLHEALTERGAALSLACFLFSSSLIIFFKVGGSTAA